VDVQRREIVDAEGNRKDLKGKLFNLLVFLAGNHDRFVTNEELIEEFWSGDGFAEKGGGDPQNVHKAISTIRRNLGDLTCIVTERSQGVRLRGPVELRGLMYAHLALSPIPTQVPDGPASRRSPWTFFAQRRLISLVVALPLVAVTLVVYWPMTRVRVVGSIPITHSGFTKYAPVIETDRGIYYTELAFGAYRIVRLASSSNEGSIVQTTVTNPYLCDVSPGGKRFLIRSVVAGFDDYGPLYIQPVDGGVAEPLPIIAFDGSWAPDGKKIVYARGPELAVFDLGNGGSKVIARVDGYSWWPRWDSTGNLIRFTVTEPQSQLTTIWEVRRDGSKLRQLFSSRDPWFHAGAGTWVQNGRYYLFHVGPLADSKLWVQDEGLLATVRRQAPVQLTSETSLRGPVLAQDGRTILARSHISRGELRVINPKNGVQNELPIQSVADMATYSPNGKELAYCVSDKERSLWVSKSNGQSPRQLVGPPLESAFPQWSPKGDRIALATRQFNEPWKITLVSPNTGVVDRMALITTNALHPSWSPDAAQIVFGTIPTINEHAYLYTVDLATRKASILAGSQGLFSPAWSPDGRYIAALRGDSYQIVLYDRITQHWAIATNFKASFIVWSRDCRYMFCFRNETDGPHFYRVAVQTLEATELLALPGFRILDRWFGLDPSGSLLVAKNIGIQEIYQLQLDRTLVTPIHGR